MDFSGKRIWLIGASQGIGLALAHELHQAGAELVLSARGREALAALATELGDRCRILPLDVADAEAVQRATQELCAIGPLDSVVYLAALYQPMALDQLELGEVEAMFQVNIGGAFNLVRAVWPLMKAEGAGQIVLCGSVAGYRGLPRAQPYAATKAAMVSLAESLYLEARGSGVDIKLVSPGFVRTRMTAKNSFVMPAMISPGLAASAVAQGMAGRAFEIRFPRPFTAVLKLLRVLPYPLYFWLVRRMLRGQDRSG